MVRTLRADPDLDNTMELDSYVILAIRDVARDRFRRHTTVMKHKDSLLRDAQDRVCVTPLDELVADEEEALQGFVRTVVEREIPRLPGELREAIELRYLSASGSTFEEIARQQGVSSATAHRRLHKALHVLEKSVRRELLRHNSRARIGT
jgi:RNA polymerase sigma factor (sigma-70 family)